MDQKVKTLTLIKNSPYVDSFRITKGTKFSKAKRNLSECYGRYESPSPQQYKYEQCSNAKKSPRFSFGKEKKFFLSRKQMKCKTEIPGPEKYVPNETRTSIRISIPQGDRLGLQIKQDTPAVGSYQIAKRSSRHNLGIKFPKQKRKSLANHSFGPSPNEYFIDPQKRISQNETFNKSKKIFTKLDGIPGVGQYSIFNFKEKNSPSARITSSRRIERKYHTIDEPGPASYTSCSLEKYKMNSKLTNAIIPKAKKDRNDFPLIPGPGDYNISQKRKKLKGAFLTSRYISQHTEEAPGPGDYQPKLDLTAEKSRSARIGKAPRIMDSKEQSPSPHDYQPQRAKIHFNSTGFTFPKRKRELQ